MYDIVKKCVEVKVGKFMSGDVVVHCPSLGRSSVLASPKKLTEEGLIIGRKIHGNVLIFANLYSDFY